MVTMVNRLRANHYNLGQSLERKGYKENARCEAEIQDINHIVMRCTQHEETKDLLYQRLSALKVRYPYDVGCDQVDVTNASKHFSSPSIFIERKEKKNASKHL